MNSEIIQYVRTKKGLPIANRNGRGTPIGVVIAQKKGNNVYLGWSLCMKTDTFSKETALSYARARAIRIENFTPQGETELAPIPSTVKPYISFMKERALLYFKKDENLGKNLNEKQSGNSSSEGVSNLEIIEAFTQSFFGKLLKKLGL